MPAVSGGGHTLDRSSVHHRAGCSQNHNKKLTTLEAKGTKTLGKHPVFKLVFTLILVNQPLLSNKTPNELLYLQLKPSYSSVPVVLIGQTETVM